MKHILITMLALLIIACGKDTDVTEFEDPIISDSEEITELTISGTVSDQDNQKIRNANLELYVDNQLYNTTVTDEIGSYQFAIPVDHLESKILVKAQKENYSKILRTVNFNEKLQSHKTFKLNATPESESNYVGTGLSDNLVIISGRITDDEQNNGYGVTSMIDQNSGTVITHSINAATDDEGYFEFFVEKDKTYQITYWTRCEPQGPYEDLPLGFPIDIFGYLHTSPDLIQASEDIILEDYLTLTLFQNFRIVEENITNCDGATIANGEIVIKDYNYKSILISNGKASFSSLDCRGLLDRYNYIIRDFDNKTISGDLTGEAVDGHLMIGSSNDCTNDSQALNVSVGGDELAFNRFDFNPSFRDSNNDFIFTALNDQSYISVKTNADGVGEFSIQSIIVRTGGEKEYQFNNDGDSATIIFNSWGEVNVGNFNITYFDLVLQKEVTMQVDFNINSTY